MGQAQMVDIGELQRSLEDAEKLKGEEKLGAMLRLREKIAKTERAYSMDFTVPFGSITQVRELLPPIESSINRLQAAKRKKEAREHV